MSQFNVGDWVRTHPGTHSAQLGPIFQIDEFSRYRADEVYLWTPSIGEWCWFWSNTSKLLIGQLKAYEDNTYFFDTPFINTIHKISGVDRCKAKYCEPFIGTLPTGAR